MTTSVSVCQRFMATVHPSAIRPAAEIQHKALATDHQDEIEQAFPRKAAVFLEDPGCHDHVGGARFEVIGRILRGDASPAEAQPDRRLTRQGQPPRCRDRA